MRNYWTKARPKSSRTNFKSCNFWCDIKGLRWLYPASFAACSTLLFLGQVLLHLCSSPWQKFCGSGFSSSLGSPIHPRFHFFTSHNGLSGLLTSQSLPAGSTCCTKPRLRSPPQTWKKALSSFSCISLGTLSQNRLDYTAKFGHLLGINPHLF